MGFLRHPRQVWVRRANFQVHLWAGIFLSLYLGVIGVTGSILVFGLELSRILDPNPWPGLTLKGKTADLGHVIDTLAAAYPHTHVISLMAPTEAEPVFIATLLRGRRFVVACNPNTGQVMGEVPVRHSRLDWVYDLHENLLNGRRGRVVNGVGAASLLLLAVTGMVNWWPGVQNWTRGLRIDFRRRWRRVNFDLHSAAGFWSFVLLAIWAGSGIYLTWPATCLSLVNHVSAVVNSRPPAVNVDPEPNIRTLKFDSILSGAYSKDPDAKWKGIIFPTNRRGTFAVLMSRSPGIGRDYEDTIYFNPYNSQYISTWKYGVNQTLGDWIIWLQIPLHFGTHWGLAVKFVWALFGLSLPVLAVTGLIMYWNRSLRRVF